MNLTKTITRMDDGSTVELTRDRLMDGLLYQAVVGDLPYTQRWADQIGADACAEDANDGVMKIDALPAR